MATVSKKCIALVKEFEGLYLKAYKDEIGKWTIGYGITNDDKSITHTIVKSGLKITEKTADDWLEKALNKKYLPKVMKYNSKYKWNQNEIDALVSFTYNVGNIDTLTANGTRSRAAIASKMLQYNKAGGKVLNGLTRRRKAENKLFLTAVATKKKVYATANTKSDPLTIREKASTTSNAIGKIPRGSKAEVIKKGSIWTKVKYKSVVGYSATRYLKF